MTERVDVAVIGAGVIGLAVTWEIARRSPGKNIVLVERNSRPGVETSSRNSGVIHAGLYYPPESLKSRLCVEGADLLYRFCKEYHVDCRNTGKIVVACDHTELRALEKIVETGRLVGRRVEMLDADQVQRLEPHVQAVAGVFSPYSGIVDTDGLVQRLAYLARRQGVITLFKSEVKGLAREQEGYRIELTGETIHARVVINAAGLNSDRIAAMAGMDIDKVGYRQHFCKGEYFQLSGRYGINHLVYPVPGKAGLGIHVTMDMAGRLRLGPSAFYVSEPDFSVDEGHIEQFYTAARRYLPNLKLEDLQPDFAGIRPKLQGPDDDFRDFVIREESENGYPGLINLIGIESPGLTSCLAIARYVEKLLGG